MIPKKFDFLWQYVDYWAEVDPTKTAIRFENLIYSWGDFRELTDNLAGYFLKSGVNKGDIIATMLPSSAAYLLSLVAADKIGAIICALDIKYKSADLKKFLSHLKPSVLIALSQQDNYNIGEAILAVEKDLGLEDGIHHLMVGESDFGVSFDSCLVADATRKDELLKVRQDQDRGDGMLVVFTGGTTGVPKAALLSKTNVTGMAYVETEFLGRFLKPDKNDNRIKTIVSLPPSHVGGTVELMGSGIVGGMEMIIHDTWSPTRVMETIQEEKVRWMGGVPTMYAIMLITPELDQYDLSSLELAVLSGEKTDIELLDLVQSKICPNLIIGYGSTEAGSEVTFTEPGDDFNLIADGYVGKPLPGVTIRIVNEDGKTLPAGESGEVQTFGDLTISHYFRMPEEDKAGFTEDGYCKTGDLGYLTSEGGLYIKGRIKHIIRVGSYTVMPSEVEEVLSQDASVGMVAVIGVPDKILGEVVWAVVNPVPGSEVDTKALMDVCNEQLAKFKVPKNIIVKNDLPLTRIGKVHRVELQNAVIKEIEGGLYD